MSFSASSYVSPILIICGPTASGKTALAERLFSFHSDSPFAGKAEIISADSMQVYKKMNIGTAKPSESVRATLPHHLIDICDPKEGFSAGDFVRLTEEACTDISARGKLPVIVGGTAFYIRNFLYGLPETPAANCELRRQIKERAMLEGCEVLWQELHSCDPVSAQRIHHNDEYRIVRALEVCIESNRPLSSFAISQTLRTDYRFCLISIEYPREQLYQHIDARVIQMFKEGLEDEVNALIALGYDKDDPGLQAIGYREFFSGCTSSEDICTLIQRNSRRYAKRQYTFFKSIADVHSHPAHDFTEILSTIQNFLKSTGSKLLD